MQQENLPINLSTFDYPFQASHRHRQYVLRTEALKAQQDLAGSIKHQALGLEPVILFILLFLII